MRTAIIIMFCLLFAGIAIEEASNAYLGETPPLVKVLANE